jgi:hypothetical protein
MNIETIAWTELGAVAPGDLAKAKAGLHGCVQLLSSFGQAHVEARPDYSQRSMTWSPDEAVFVSEPTEGETPTQARIRLRDMKFAIRSGDAIVAERSLEDGTLEEAFLWIEEEMERLQGMPRVPLGRPDGYVLTNPVLGARSPEVGEGPLRELEAWFANSDAILQEARLLLPDTTPVRCWPHHFDIATLSTLDPELGPEDGRSVSVGMSPGDEGYTSPYFYVTPYPYPEAVNLPHLPSGAHWHTEGWVGAVLTADALVSAGDSASQREACWAFLTTAIDASKESLAL